MLYVIDPDKVVGICMECFADITVKDEMLPDYPTLYQCPECSHPNGPYEKE
jgi:DNA-directed RNA polymerase subunit RPC12/RpoP